MTQTTARRNVRLLAASQALMLSAVVLAMTLAAILGAMLAPDQALATLPVAAMVIGTALTSTAAALFMHRFGRRLGFSIGAGLGLAGSLVSAWGLQTHTFVTFVLGHLLIGAYQGFASYYRFAAVEAAGPAGASRAISRVVLAGVIAAFAGPQIAVWGRDWIVGDAFVGSYLAQALLSVLALVMIAQLRLPPIAGDSGGAARPLREIAAQPALRASVFGTAVGYAVMIMAMTATPLAMLGCGLDTTDVSPVIQWHVVGMFAPSFFTGTLVSRYGAPRIMQIGFALLLGHVAVSVAGTQWLHFLAALILLGVGWNFAFIGGTALLTQTYRPSESSKVQALNESLVFGVVALASLGAGWLYARFGWSALNLATVPLLLMAWMAAIGIGRRQRTAAVPA